MELLNTNDNASTYDKENPLREEKRRYEISGFNPIYLNRAQQQILRVNSRATAVLGGRGLGKTTILGVHLQEVSQKIYRGTNLFVGPSLRSLMTRIQPSVIKTMEQTNGLRDGVHFFRCMPPPKLKWPTPLAKPRSYDCSLTFYTGCITYFTSIMSKASGNSLNLTSLMCDETRFIDFPKLVSECLPALRGEMYDNPAWNRETSYLYLSQFYMSDMAVSRKQALWQKEFLKLVTPEVNEQIVEMLAEVDVCPQLAQMPKFIDRLNRLRAKSGYMHRFSSLYNAEVLSEDFIRQMKLQLPPVLFDVQIMSKDFDADSENDQYYYCFNPDIHTYTQNEDDTINAIYGNSNKVHKGKDGYGIRYEWESPDLDVTASHADDDYYDVDLDPKHPLCLAWDLNANFNTVVISQRIPHGARTEIRIVNCLYTKYQEKLRALLAKFCGYYAHRKGVNRHLIIQEDPTMRQGQQYALEGANSRYADIIRDVLTRAGWDIEVQQMGTPMDHNEKHQLINDVLAGHKPFDVRINKELDFLIAAIDAAKAIDTRKGVAKDKSKEKLKSERGEDDDPGSAIGVALEKRTDVTDALDIAILGALKATYGIAPRGTAGVHFIMPSII